MTLHARIYSADAKEIKRLAKSNGRTPSQEVQFAVRQYVASNPQKKVKPTL